MRATVDFILGRFLALLMAIMTMDVLWGVFTRYVLDNQAGWTEELARFLLIWISILGAAYASGKNMHLAIDLLSPKLGERGNRTLGWVIRTLVIFFVLTVLVIGGFRLIYISQVLGQTSPALQIPMWTVYMVVPISGLLIIYYKLTEPNTTA